MSPFHRFESYVHLGLSRDQVQVQILLQQVWGGAQVLLRQLLWDPMLGSEALGLSHPHPARGTAFCAASVQGSEGSLTFSLNAVLDSGQAGSANGDRDC